MTNLELIELEAQVLVELEICEKLGNAPLTLQQFKQLVERARRANALEHLVEIRADFKERYRVALEAVKRLQGKAVDSDVQQLINAVMTMLIQPPMACITCEEHNEDLADIIAALAHNNPAALQPRAKEMYDRIVAGTEYLKNAKLAPDTEESFQELITSLQGKITVDPAAGSPQTSEVFVDATGKVLDVKPLGNPFKPQPRRGVDSPCEGCGKLEGSGK